MGTPEWEDADIEGDVDDQFHPDWTSLNLNGFVRPTWFVQGPLPLSLEYLAAKSEGDDEKAQLYWSLLGEHNKTRVKDQLQEQEPSRTELFLHRIHRALRRWVEFLSDPNRIHDFLTYRLGRLRQKLLDVPMVGRIVAAIPVAFVKVLIRGATRAYRSVLNCCRLFKAETPVPNDTTHAELLALFKHRFPERNDLLERDDFSAHLRDVELWEAVLKNYDIVQGYATAPMFPLFFGSRYFAFEHGTLRTLPFENSAMGRLTALSYSEAEHVFVTNSDCLDNAKTLAGDKVSSIPHPYDERILQGDFGQLELRQELRAQLDCEFLLFYPTRHDWVEGDGFADKANDIFLRAFASLRSRGHKIGLITCAWGKNVEQSKALLSELNAQQFVRWRSPMGSVEYNRVMLASDVVVDQFLLGAFGGVTFRALAAGVPVCTYLKDEEVAASFGSSPPILNCRTQEEIENVLDFGFNNPNELKAIGERAKNWYASSHSGLKTACLQLEKYVEHLSERSAVKAR